MSHLGTGLCGASEMVDALAAGLLDQLYADSVRQHLSGCVDCREQHALLDGIKDAYTAAAAEEMLLDGPPPDNDLVLARAMRGVRAEIGTARRRRFRVGVAAGIVAVAVAVAGGVVAGRLGGSSW